jgi:hypothetical protein
MVFDHLRGLVLQAPWLKSHMAASFIAIKETVQVMSTSDEEFLEDMRKHRRVSTLSLLAMPFAARCFAQRVSFITGLPSGFRTLHAAIT